MGNNIIQKKYSLRKFKGIGLASAVIGLFFANQSVYANVTADGKDETTIVGQFDKVSSSAKTTFTDDQNPTKKVTVDAVADIRYKKPTKANQNTGDADGTDVLNFTSKATVNYLVDKTNEVIKTKEVDTGTGTITTSFDKKGLDSDADGKDYRDSIVNKDNVTLSIATGSEDVITSNGKEYRLVRSEVVDKDKAFYEKTKFNDIEAPVSPEGMHNNLGEINYGKITGKVYLVEETTDGKYGKFVEATNIKSDEEAVNAWKNGQATAKEFSKANVTLKEGDTVLVMDRDTYAHGSGTRTVNTNNYRREKVPATPEFDKVESSEEIKDVNAYPSYALDNETVSGNYVAAGADHNFGTSDDGEVTFNGEQYLLYRYARKLENSLPEVKDTPELDFSKSSLNEIMRYMQSEVFGVLEYFDYYAKTDAERQLIQERRTKLEQNIADTIQMIKNENISMAAAKPDDRYTTGLVFYSPDREKLTAIKKQIESGEKVLDELRLTLKTDEENVEQYENKKDVKKITKEILLYELNHKDIYGRHYGYPRFSYRTVVSYHKDAESEHYSDWEKVYPEVETREDSVYANKGVVTISDDLSKIKVVNAESTTKETEFTKQDVTTREETDYVVKEIITPVRAYKVMGENGPVVNHYYKMVTRRSENPTHTENTKVGTVTVQYVSSSGEKLKADETVELNTPYEVTKTYDVFSGTTKVGEEKVVETLNPIYDATPKRFNTIIGDKTGFAYEFEAIAYGSAPERSTIDKPQTIVSYVYRFVSKEDPTPVKKEVKGSVIVKYVDAEGNEIKSEEIVKQDAVIKTIYTYFTKSGDKVISTRERVNYELLPVYNTQDKRLNEITTQDGKKYKYQGIYPVSEKFHNVIAENGILEEGTTTVVYQYVLEPKKVEWEVSEKPPILEIPEFKGGVISEKPPVLDVPEFNGSVNGELDEPLTLPQLIITKWVDEYGNELKPTDAKSPSVEGGANEAFEPGTIEGYEFIGTIPVDANGIVTHVFKKKQAYKPEEPKPEPKQEPTPEPKPEPKKEEPRKEEPKKEEPKTNDVTPSNEGNEHQTSVPTKKVEELPQTGTGQELAIFGAAASSILAGLGLVIPGKQKKE
ncbi:SIALI-17 repeat-containing surface protein [Granulicatella elegans]|uniref:SIALI-17 repeat-containing surface protein n=1 Tax=Granulicatella elegans TaxID=137732 RepID=UPI0028D2E9B1|nr:SIALI-17 repeat-containing surface protein [Granulicatella elegans]